MKMALLRDDSVSFVDIKEERLCNNDEFELKDIKEEICFAEDSLLFSNEEASSSLPSEYSPLQVMNFKQEDILTVSNCVVIIVV